MLQITTDAKLRNVLIKMETSAYMTRGSKKCQIAINMPILAKGLFDNTD